LNWYAIYTNPRAEKRAYAQLLEKGIETYLPLIRTLRQWSDRKKWVEEPLFRSYLFVHVSEKEYLDVLNTQGVVRYITFEGRAVPVPQKQIDAIKFFLHEKAPDILPDTSNLVPGQEVEVVRGPLNGLKGELVEVKGQQKVRVQIDALGRYLHLTIAIDNLRVG
jgi:transcription antitermination factor NusG